MTFATNKQFIERSGVGVRVVDENVGTGNNTLVSFDLDNDNIISDTYILNHAVSGSNDFTALTETTDYTIDKESGRILLEAAGVTEVGTDIIYATYWYSETFSDSVVTDMLANSASQIEKLTGRYFGTPIGANEYKDGRASLGYPTTNAPYTNDWEAPDFIVLNQWPVTKIDFVYFLNSPLAVDKVYNYDDSAATYTDNTESSNSTTETPFTVLADTDDILYIGSSDRFLGLDLNLSTDGTGSPAIDWEYYNGTAWVDLTETDTDTGASTLTASGKFTWTYPYGWTESSVNSSNTMYWVRGKVSSGFTIDPIIATITLKDGINEILEPRQILFKNTGQLNFMNTSVPNGTQNIRIDYNYGYSTVPDYIEELEILLTSVQAYINLSGGSYDDATSYSLGSKSVTIGEVYVNIREVITQFKKRIEEILDMIGKRADVTAI